MTITVHKVDKSDSDCFNCPAFSQCLSYALDGLQSKCIHFGCFKEQVDECVDKINNVGLVYPLSPEEIKNLIYFTSTQKLRTNLK